MIAMFKTLSITMILALIAIGCGDVGDAPKAKTGDKVEVEKAAGSALSINKEKSKVSWTAAKVTRSHEGGFKDFSGSVTLNDGKVANVDLTVDVKSIFCDTEKLTTHLKSPDFFDVEKFPTAKFEASSFEAKGDTAGNTHIVTGNLTMHGVTHSVSFPAKINVANNVVTATANFIVNRQDWAITYPGAPDDLINNDVRILFDIVAE